MSRLGLLPFFGLAAATACSASNSLPEPAATGGSAGTAVAAGAAGSEAGGTSTAGGSAGSATAGAAGSGVSLGGSGPGPDLDSLIYAHTDKELFQLDAKTDDLDLKALGEFECQEDGAMTDLAVDSQKNIWAVSASFVHRLEIGNQTVSCAEKIALKNASKEVRYYGLSFAPAGILGESEVLVAGNTAGELWSIDGEGSVKKLGTFGNVPKNDGNGHNYANSGKAWELSGDIVFLANGGSPLGYATVRDCPKPPSAENCNETNTLIELDLSKLKTANGGSVTKSVRGQIVEAKGCKTPAFDAFGQMFGIAAWDDKVYGFSRSGNLVDINVKDGTGCFVQNYPDFKFAGAGVTTLAPVLPPPPK